ncbi:MAG: insulinase family protein [Oscillospiraceae bacterium]|nr:insulinase family protein [Oscillospiraceae bacterium]
MMNRKEYAQIDETLYIGRLSNGLSVFVSPKNGYHKCCAFFATDYGSMDTRFKFSGNWIETPDGTAHFLEHKLFDMEDGNAITLLSENGASANAFTSTDITAYHFECIDKFQENLKMLLRFVSAPHFTPEGVEKERGIISQEILMDKDDPDYCLYYGLMESLFSHSPLRVPITGTVESIEEITPETLYKCHNAFYVPSNMALCVVGDVEPTEVFDIAESALAAKMMELPERDYGLREPPRPAASRFSKDMDVSLPIFLAGCKTDPVPCGQERLRLELVGALTLDILAGHSSPLYFRLYKQGLVSSDFSASFDVSSGVAYTIFGGETREPERVFDEVNEEIARLLKEGPDTELLSRVKKALLGGFIRSLNSFDAICGNIVSSYFQRYDSFETPEILSSITGSDVAQFLQNSLISDNMAISVIYPKSQQLKEEEETF